MLSIHNIWTVARYETRTLLRSWFFRIFSVGAIVILTFLNIPFFALPGNTPWLFRGISSSIPYMNILLLNVVQAIIGVFLASDFLKRDKKLDTTEVIYMRSMTNGDYVLGKFLGILTVFIGLNIIVLLIGVVFNIFFSDVSFVFTAYLFYPLFISIPTLVFIFGLSFLFMVTIRNQAVTFIILLGYIAITLFFLAQKFHHLFDYMAFNVPLMYSDFVGFGNLNTLLIHRGIYFLLGLGFIFSTILMIKRLPQSRTMTKASAVLSAIFLLTAIVLSGIYLTRISSAKNLRQQMVELNRETNKLDRVTPMSWKLDLNHNGKKINVTAKLSFKNSSDRALDKYIFSLNPGLSVQQVIAAGGDLKYDRKLHILTIFPSDPLLPNQEDSLIIKYRGGIDENAAYLDVDEEDREQIYRVWLYNIAKRFSFVEPDYVLLTPEVMWYPIAGVPYGATYPELSQKSFTNFQLNVKTGKKLIAVSQGKKTEFNPGEYSFKPEHPIPQLSLVIGNYETRSIRVDSIDYQLFNLTGHDYFASFFDEIGDTLAALIRESKQDFENKLELSYPFPRLTLIEVPIQFFSYNRIWTTTQETVQPEIVLLPEKALFIDAADFKRMEKYQDRRRERSNQTLTPQEIQSELFNRFVRSALLGGFAGGRFGMSKMIKAPINYSVFPNFYSYVNHFHSAQYPIFNVALESFLNDRVGEQPSSFRRFFVGLTDQEKANLALMKQNLAEIMADPDKKDILNTVLKLKGSFLFKLIQGELEPETFQKFLTGILNKNHFKSADVAEFIATLNQQYGFDLEPFFDNWYHDRQLPGFLLADIQAYKVLDDDRTRFQVKFKVSNTDSVDGLLSLTFRVGGGMRFFGGGPQEAPEEKFISLAPGQTREIGIVLDDQPRRMMVNTLISKNLPAVIDKMFRDLELNEKATPFEGERDLDKPIKLALPGEIIVDNEDSGFEILYQPTTGFLKKLLQSKKEDEEEYIGVNFWRPPNQWRATTAVDFYGKYIHSAYFIKSGDGNKKVAWNARIKAGGNYDIYYYASNIRPPWFRGRGRDGNRKRDQFIEQFHFLIHHDDGVSEEILDAAKAETGWNFLGTYYMSAGQAKVELTDESKGRIVFADAVKWVKQ